MAVKTTGNSPLFSLKFHIVPDQLIIINKFAFNL